MYKELKKMAEQYACKINGCIRSEKQLAWKVLLKTMYYFDFSKKLKNVAALSKQSYIKSENATMNK